MKILIAVDESDASTAAVAATKALFPEADYLLLSVADMTPLMVTDPIGGGVFTSTTTTAAMESVEEGADAAIAVAERQIHAAESSVEIGEPGRMICEEAARVKPDVVVVGRSSRSWLSRLFEPSVADYVVKHARCPVLVVNEPAHAPD